MRRHDKEITDREVVNEIIKNSEICRLGFTDVNQAYIVPVNYAFHDGSIFIHSARAGRKIDLIRKNNRVCFEIEGPNEIVKDAIPCNWSARYRSVMGQGTIEILEDKQSKITGLDLIMRKYDAQMELTYDDAVLARMLILKLTIESVTGKQSGNW